MNRDNRKHHLMRFVLSDFVEPDPRHFVRPQFLMSADSSDLLPVPLH